VEIEQYYPQIVAFLVMENTRFIAESVPRQREGSGLTLADVFTYLYVTTSPTSQYREPYPTIEGYALKARINA